MAQAQSDAWTREMQLQSILDSSLDSIIIINKGGIVESANRTTWHMFGYQPEELIGQNISILMPEPYQTDHDNYLRRYLETGNAAIIGIGREVVCLRKDGSMFPAELSISEIRGDGYHAFTGTIRDISERKEMEVKLQQREKELAHIARLSTVGEMAAGLAHELNQPLGAISNFAGNCLHLIERGDLAGLRTDLQEVVALTARCGEIIRRIRRYLKKREPNREYLELAEPVANVLAFVKRDARLNGVVVHAELPQEPMFIFGDSIQIEQVLLNLARNAMDAMVESRRSDKTLTIKVIQSETDGVEISVHDTGDGIPPEIMSRICEPFVSSKNNGLGMGLSICRTIVEAHNGSLHIASDPGLGTCVRIRLPNADDGHTSQ